MLSPRWIPDNGMKTPAGCKFILVGWWILSPWASAPLAATLFDTNTCFTSNFLFMQSLSVVFPCFFIQWEGKQCDLVVYLSSGSINHWLMHMVTNEHLSPVKGNVCGEWQVKLSLFCFRDPLKILCAFLWCSVETLLRIAWSTSCFKMVNKESSKLSHTYMKDEHP